MKKSNKTHYFNRCSFPLSSSVRVLTQETVTDTTTALPTTSEKKLQLFELPTTPAEETTTENTGSRPTDAKNDIYYYKPGNVHLIRVILELMAVSRWQVTSTLWKWAEKIATSTLVRMEKWLGNGLHTRPDMTPVVNEKRNTREWWPVYLQPYTTSEVKAVGNLEANRWKKWYVPFQMAR